MFLCVKRLSEVIFFLVWYRAKWFSSRNQAPFLLFCHYHIYEQTQVMVNLFYVASNSRNKAKVAIYDSKGGH